MAELAPFSVFPVQLVERTGEPLLTRSGRPCPNRYRRPAYEDGWLSPRAGGRIHRAVDIMAPEGSIVRAPLGGRVIKSSRTTGETPKGGHHLTLRVASGHTLYFAHLAAAPLVGVGDEVQAGDQLGIVGRTGNASATCPHLHFSVSDRAGQKFNAYGHLVASDPFVKGRPSRPRRSIVQPHAAGTGEHDGVPRPGCCCCSASSGLSGSTSALDTDADDGAGDAVA